MPKANAARRRALLRDKRRCGIHLGGCGEVIPSGQRHSLDHIVPKSLFAKVAAGRQSEFEQDWNYQPMHEECNSDKGFQWHEWPRFACTCHYLQVLDGDLWIFTKGKVGHGRHLLLADVVSAFAESPERVDAKFIPGQHINTKGEHLFGYRTDRYGFVIPGIHARRVEMFNLEQQARVGLPTPNRIYLDEQGRVTPLDYASRSGGDPRTGSRGRRSASAAP